jgi:hypothetical protein
VIEGIGVLAIAALIGFAGLLLLGEYRKASMQANHALEPTAARGLRRLAVPSSLRPSAAGYAQRWASGQSTRRRTDWRRRSWQM